MWSALLTCLRPTTDLHEQAGISTGHRLYTVQPACTNPPPPHPPPPRFEGTLGVVPDGSARRAVVPAHRTVELEAPRACGVLGLNGGWGRLREKERASVVCLCCERRWAHPLLATDTRRASPLLPRGGCRRGRRGLFSLCHDRPCRTLKARSLVRPLSLLPPPLPPGHMMCRGCIRRRCSAHGHPNASHSRGIPIAGTVNWRQKKRRANRGRSVREVVVACACGGGGGGAGTGRSVVFGSAACGACRHRMGKRRHRPSWRLGA